MSAYALGMHGVVMSTYVSTARPHGRLREWFARYAPAEVGATLGALVVSSAVQPFGVAAATAFAGSIGDGLGFYAVLFVRDLRGRPRGPRGRAVANTLRALVLEFGPAEVLDSFLVRPLAMYLGARWLGNATAGVVAGKVAADVVFYTLAILAYELRKHVAGRRRVQARGAARVGPAQPPAIAPTMRNGSSPATTLSGSGASGDSLERSSSHA